jgi:5-methylcytosine-specific restriction endonuclease McrA
VPTKLQRSRQLAFQHQGGKCFYCEATMWLEGPPGARSLRCTAEHLIPRSEGGGDGPDNIVAACARCNHTRHKRKRPPTPAVYRQEVQRRVSRGGWHPRWVFQRGLVSRRLPDTSPGRLAV